MRLFLSLWPSMEVLNKLNAYIEPIRQKHEQVKWVAKENLHLTLKFFGEVEEKKLFELEKSIEEALVGTSEFSVVFRGFGVFPNSNNPKIVFVKTDYNRELSFLAKKIEICAKKHGFEESDKGFVSHLTLGRIKAWSEKLILDDNVYFGESLIKSVALVESTLTPKGPIYNNLKIFSFN